MHSAPATDGLAQAFTLGDTYLFGANIVNCIPPDGESNCRRQNSPADYDDRRSRAGRYWSQERSAYEPHDPHVQRHRRVQHSRQFTARADQNGAIFAVNDDLSVVRGNHQTGLWRERRRVVGRTLTRKYVHHGCMAFNGQTTGLGMADFFMGNASQFHNGHESDQNKRSKYIGLYGADTWKVNQKLTLNYGLRWEPYFPMINLDGSAIHFDHDALRKGIKSNAV